MTRIRIHIPKAKLPFYPPCEVKCRLQNGVSTVGYPRFRFFNMGISFLVLLLSPFL